MVPPESNVIASKKLAAIFSNKSESYKLFWFSGLLKAVSEGKTRISFNEIINNMIAAAWYMVSEYHLDLGPTDTLEKLVLAAQPKSNLKASATEKEILKYLETTTDPVVQECKRTLSLMVPFRLQAPFVPDLKGDAWNSQRVVIDRMNASPDVIYHYDNAPALSRSIIVQDKWMAYLSNNLAILKGWLDYHMIQYLQRRNPSIPGIACKLAPPGERKLEKAKDFWKSVIGYTQIANIYDFSGPDMTTQDVSIDHFVPWSFVAHDELWNLVPTTKSLNSSKSNNLPCWDVYFPHLCDIEYASYSAIWQSDRIHSTFDKCAQEHVNTDDARMKLYEPGLDKEVFSAHLKEILLPSYKAAQNIGFLEWSA